ncbi:hypothetical protein [Gynuella sunshinyii]|uniref:Uncharacterized protein n=1 Tax=Gynuella sunshinyii YC6258 TaxID=1445510 RepID=A0A0C5VHR0_9GAMM|nr:hypothetical protein [Gynuella sunshinyii]AJQ93771.1 hypothetical Protein YC6258_01723 [Gynuella sunshinyii YC6258]
MANFKSLLLVDAAERKHGYQELALSVFDHWLDSEEASELLDNVQQETDDHRTSSIFNFHKDIVQNF